MALKWWKSLGIGLAIIILLALFVFGGYKLPWTGFGEQQIIETSTRMEFSGGAETVTETIEEKTEPAKNLWDWLDLFIVSAVVALGLFWLRQREDKRDEKRQEQEMARQVDSQHQDALQGYFDKMSALLLKEHLGGRVDQQAGEVILQDISSGGEDPNSNAAVIARARTLAVLRYLDPTRVSAVFRFLEDAQLVEIVPLAGGDLRRVVWKEADLSGADLRGADLRWADLSGANLSGANLLGANLSGANLSRLSDSGEANLSNAKLRRADLSEANLMNAKLFSVYLGEANLSEANLRFTDLRKAYLDRADLRGANLSPACLSGALLTGALFDKANLSNADLSEAHLGKADLSGANLRGANLRGAIYSDSTVWPKDFDPKT